MPWKRLLQARHQYVEWNAFGLWAEAIAKAEGGVPRWLAQNIEERCPGLLASEPLPPEADSDLGVHLDRRILGWIQDHVLAESKREGWLQAVTFYALRDPACVRDQAYAQWCAGHWRHECLPAYPPFQEWRSAAEQCSNEVLEAFPMREDKRRIIKVSRAIGTERLAAAVAEYMEWEAFTYWLRSLLEADTEFPAPVTRELERRCPDFLESDKALRAGLARENNLLRWKALLEWGEERYFAVARKEGWFNTVVFYARAHPRSARTVDYWVFHWDDHWSTQPLDTYPSFQEWRREADDYVMPSGDE